MSRPVPPALERLPEQFFTGILAAAAAAREQPGPRVIDLGRGNPDLPPPAVAIRALQEAAAVVDTPRVHGYPPFSGLPELKAAIADRYRADHGVELDPDTEVAVVPGTKTAICLAVQAAVAPGETVALPDPGYPDYLSGVALAGARVVPLGLDASAGWQPDWSTLDGEDPALTVLNYPSNPCAVLAADGTLEEAVARAQANGTWLMHDLAYGFLAYDGRRARSVLEIEGAREVAVELWSASKVHGMAGWRVGFAVGNKELVRRIQELIDHTSCGVFSAVQHGLLAALRSDQADVRERVAVYTARRDRLVAALTAAGGEVSPCEGSFYVWWKLPPGVTGEALLAEQRVAVAPGEGFGARGAGWARLSLAVPDVDLDEGAKRLAEVVASALR